MCIRKTLFAEYKEIVIFGIRFYTMLGQRQTFLLNFGHAVNESFCVYFLL